MSLLTSLDQSIVFDTIDLNVLLNRLSHSFDISGTVFKWFISKFLVTDDVLSNFVRNRLREQGEKNGSKDRTLGNTIFQGQRGRV